MAAPNRSVNNPTVKDRQMLHDIHVSAGKNIRHCLSLTGKTKSKSQWQCERKFLFTFVARTRARTGSGTECESDVSQMAGFENQRGKFPGK